MSGALRIEAMGEEHLRAVLAIEDQAFAEPWSEGMFRSELAGAHTRYVVALCDGTVAGYAGITALEGDAHVSSIAVAPSLQRRGLGTLLMCELADIARRAGSTVMSLEVRTTNMAAQRLYRRFGFAPVGVRRNYYRESGEDAFVMQAVDVGTDAYGARVEGARARLTSLTGERRHGGLAGIPDLCVLAIETSCDETAAAVLAGGALRSSVVSSQVDLHVAFGGVVPEIASRAHLRLVRPVVAEAMAGAQVRDADVGAVAVTVGPGLAGALIVGIAAAKACALAWRVPLAGVNHLEAHLFASWLDPDGPPEMPAVVLLASGGHTMLVEMRAPGRYRLIGRTLDDAAGEAFDKVARYLGLGYPGGPAIEAAAASGDPSAVRLPRSVPGRAGDFSFSGLKTAVVRAVEADPGLATADVAASFQAACVDTLVAKTMAAARARGAATVVLAGGVAANSLLRERIAGECRAAGVRAAIPERSACTDNAAMVALAGAWRLVADGPSPMDCGAAPDLMLTFEG